MFQPWGLVSGTQALAYTDYISSAGSSWIDGLTAGGHVCSKVGAMCIP